MFSKAGLGCLRSGGFPSAFKGNRDVDAITSHIDFLPTLAQLCGAKLPADRIIDGQSLVQYLKGEAGIEAKERTLYNSWARGYPRKI